MLTDEMINEMVRIARTASRMCSSHPICDDCPARKINCEFTGNNQDLAELIRIIDRYNRECAEPKQDDPGPAKDKNAQGIEERLHELELYRMQMQLWTEQIEQRIEKIEEHAAHQDCVIMCDCVHVDDDAADVAPVRHAHWVYKRRRSGGFRIRTGLEKNWGRVKVLIDERTDTMEPFCSACGAHNDSTNESNMRYCPHCGAKMDEEEKQ